MRNPLGIAAATITAHGRTWSVPARLLTGDERDRRWAVLAAHWPS
ncbi:MAG TPA: hypothetical protein VHX38_09180 [Pseudonocardiaceae bacterium]|jgi:hypothetical protein|nr:hypothetical protein [Pseudonocardiaceae bacterium]